MEISKNGVKGAFLFSVAEVVFCISLVGVFEKRDVGGVLFLYSVVAVSWITEMYSNKTSGHPDVLEDGRHPERSRGSAVYYCLVVLAMLISWPISLWLNSPIFKP